MTWNVLPGEGIQNAPAYTSCLSCGLLVLTQVWVHNTKLLPAHWMPLDVPRTAFWTIHTCSLTSSP